MITEILKFSGLCLMAFTSLFLIMGVILWILYLVDCIKDGHAGRIFSCILLGVAYALWCAVLIGPIVMVAFMFPVGTACALGAVVSVSVVVSVIQTIMDEIRIRRTHEDKKW